MSVQAYTERYECTSLYWEIWVYKPILSTLLPEWSLRCANYSNFLGTCAGIAKEQERAERLRMLSVQQVWQAQMQVMQKRWLTGSAPFALRPAWSHVAETLLHGRDVAPWKRRCSMEETLLHGRDVAPWKRRCMAKLIAWMSVSKCSSDLCLEFVWENRIVCCKRTCVFANVWSTSMLPGWSWHL